MNFLAYGIYRIFFMSDKARQEEEEKKFKDALWERIRKRKAQKSIEYKGERELSEVLWHRYNKRRMFVKAPNGYRYLITVITPCGEPVHPWKAITMQDMVPFYNQLREEAWEFYNKQHSYKDKNGYFSCEKICERYVKTMNGINSSEENEMFVYPSFADRICIDSSDYYRYGEPYCGQWSACRKYWLEHTNFFKYDSSSLEEKKNKYKIR